MGAPAGRQMFDEDNNGSLDYNEFLVLVVRPAAARAGPGNASRWVQEFMGLEEERATQLFSYADRNKTGTITFQEFERIWLRVRCMQWDHCRRRRAPSHHRRVFGRR